MLAQSHVGDFKKPSALRRALYFASVRIAFFLCGQSWFRNLGERRKRHAALVALFLKEAGFPIATQGDIIRNALLTNMISDLWGARLLYFAPLIVEGQEHIEKIRAVGTGIILVRLHQKFATAGRYSTLQDWLNRQTFRPAIKVGDRTAVRSHVPEEFSNAQDLMEASRVLRKGGVVEILPDGPNGRQTIQLDFHGRERAFRTGFAELALATQARLIPIYLQFRGDGTIVITISSPFQLQAGATKEQQIAQLVDQYAKLLGEFWKTNPHLIVYHYMRQHIKTRKIGRPLRSPLCH